MTSIPVVQVHPTPKRPAKMASSQSLNYLLNFTLPPRQTRPLTNLPRRSRKTGAQQGVWNKERFVNAQYRFVMNPTGDYTVHFADPDIFFQWNDILQVIIPRSSALASAASSRDLSFQDESNTICPICLSSPIAPRMTKCGHVYCFPCILHYLGMSDNKWARCPICFDSVNEKQLKSVKWDDGPIYEDDDTSAPVSSSSSSHIDDDGRTALHTGSTMRMRLMQRPQITTLALPRSKSWPSDVLPPHQAPFHFLPDVFSFAKFMLATPAYLNSDLSRDLDELATERRVLSSMNDDLGISFVDGAEQKVKNQLAKVFTLDSSSLKEKIDKALRDQRELEERFAFHEGRRNADGNPQLPPSEVPEEFLALKSGGTIISNIPPESGDTLRSIPAQARNLPKHRRNVNPPPPSTSTYYYYQAASGLPIFLHPLDIKILLSHFHSYPSFPDTITIRVESFSESTVNDDLRKRCKYLGHIPEGADVVFIEADLEGVVGAEGLKNFEGGLKLRTSRRKEKGRKDDRARARAEEQEREKGMRTVVTRDEVFFPSSPLVPDSPAEDHAPLPNEPVRPQMAGAWGARSFASALHSTPASHARQPTPQPREVDEWDMDEAWHELDRNAGGGRKKRGNRRLVVLGSGAAGGRRR